MMIIVFPSSWHDNTMLTPFPFFHGATLRKWWDQATGNGHSSIFINIITIFVRVINIFRPLSRGKEGHRIHFLQVLKQVFCCWAAQEMGAKLQSRAECGFTQAKGCRRKIWIICRNLTSSGILVNNLSKYLSYLPFANWDFWSMTPLLSTSSSWLSVAHPLLRSLTLRWSHQRYQPVFPSNLERSSWDSYVIWVIYLGVLHHPWPELFNF